jgi:hypothetical protein
MQQDSSCRYTELAGGIHQFQILDNSHAAIDTWIAMMQEFIRHATSNPALVREPVLVLIEPPLQILPILYTFTQLRAMIATRPPSQRPTAVVVLYRHYPIHLVHILLRALRLPETFALFPYAEREQALAWLYDFAAHARSS